MKSLSVGQHQVEDHQIGAALFHLAHPGAALHVGDDLVALDLQHVGESAHDGGLILDQQNPRPLDHFPRPAARWARTAGRS